jgi:hypothetical protein
MSSSIKIHAMSMIFHGQWKDLTAKTHFCSLRGQEAGVSKNKELGRLFFSEILTSRLFAGTSGKCKNFFALQSLQVTSVYCQIIPEAQSAVKKLFL